MEKPTTKDEKREKCLKGIFDFYSRQQMLVGKKATFDEIQRELNNMNMGEFLRFILDFGIPIKKDKVVLIFKKISTHSREISYEEFKQILIKIFVEFNKQKARTLKKRLEAVNKTNIIGKALFRDIQN